MSELNKIRSIFKETPVLKISKSSDNLVEALKRFRKNAPESETIRTVVSIIVNLCLNFQYFRLFLSHHFHFKWNLIGMSLKGPVCDTNDTNLMLDKSGDDSSDESSESGITVDKMKEVQQQLSDLLTPEQTQQAMKILHGLRAEATEEEKQAAIVSSYNVCIFIHFKSILFFFILFVARFGFISKTIIES